MKKQLTFLYGLLCYVVFLGVFLYTVAFLGNWFVPKTIDVGVSQRAGIALWINVGLMARLRNPILLHHTLTGWWTRFIPEAARRSTLILFGSAFMGMILWNWRPMPDVVWQIEHAGARLALWALSVGGWLLVLVATFRMDHFRLFGLRQVYQHLHGQPCGDAGTLPSRYCRRARRALLAGLLVALWATPAMTVGHLVFAAGMTAYVLLCLYTVQEPLARWGQQMYQMYRIGRVCQRKSAALYDGNGAGQRPVSA